MTFLKSQIEHFSKAALTLQCLEKSDKDSLAASKVQPIQIIVFVFSIEPTFVNSAICYLNLEVNGFAFCVFSWRSLPPHILIKEQLKVKTQTITGRGNQDEAALSYIRQHCLNTYESATTSPFVAGLLSCRCPGRLITRSSV